MSRKCLVYKLGWWLQRDKMVVFVLGGMEGSSRACGSVLFLDLVVVTEMFSLE